MRSHLAKILALSLLFAGACGASAQPRTAAPLGAGLMIKHTSVFVDDQEKALRFYTEARGAEFTMPPTEVTGSTIATLHDTCGNLLQLTQLARW